MSDLTEAREITRLRLENESLRRAIDIGTQDAEKWRAEAELQAAIARSLELSSPRQGAGVAVKPLKWHESHHTADDCSATARSAVGFYEAYAFRSIGASKRMVYGWRHGSHETVVSSLDEAKAASQADYEKHIRSALYAHPAPATVEMREALEDIAAFDSEMRGYADVGYFDGGELSKAWKRQAAPAIDRLRAALAPATEGRKG